MILSRITHGWISLLPEIKEHYIVILCALAYISILSLVLKTFHYNKDRLDD
jgi:hypothetical protein